MSHTAQQSALPSFQRQLRALSAMLDKAANHASNKNFDEKILVNARLAPDMFALARQIQIACDFAKGGAARLANVAVPKFEDNESTLAELQARIAKTLEFINSIEAAQFADCDQRTVTLKLGARDYSGSGAEYVRDVVFPHFYFHSTTAYAILRQQGVALGKADFIGE
jgi:uncharacterized protein